MKKIKTRVNFQVTLEEKLKLQKKTRRAHGTDPCDLEKKIFERTNNRFGGDCLTESHELLKGVVETFPRCAIEFRVRNFTDLEQGIKTITVYVPGLGWGRAYNHYVPVELISPELAKFLKNKAKGKLLGAGKFYDLGQQIADILQREFIILHQIGGEQETADFHEYEFSPKLRKK